MSFSIQTNANSLIAQENLRVNSNFQSQTIRRLTSGYRINQSGDDAAGLAVANKFRSDTAELTQGVRNANDGVSQLQIADGGMSNISKMLDRLKTLAAQSGSATFTGDRTVLNSEFSTLVGEIDRQASAIGLNTGGDFAKSLSVYLGGGKGVSDAALIANGTVTMDLSRATVDSQSLSLKGVQAVNGSAYDLGASSGSSVQKVVTDATNLANLSTANNTVFKFMGPGFSDVNGVAVAVNISGVGDMTSLVSAINAAISSAAGQPTAQAAAFKAAGITAAIVTDSSGNQKLGFSSSTAAFQVQAQDLMSNALMGNLAVAANPTGASMSYTITANNPSGIVAATATVNVRIIGSSLSSPIDLSVSGVAGDTQAQMFAKLQTALNANSILVGSGFTVDTANFRIVNGRGEAFRVEVTNDNGSMGMGAFLKGGLGGTAMEYSDITAAGTFAGNSSTATVNLNFSFNGGQSVTISAGQVQGTDTAQTMTDKFNALIAANATLNQTDIQVINNTGTLEVKSVSGTLFRLSVTASAASANMGFGGPAAQSASTGYTAAAVASGASTFNGYVAGGSYEVTNSGGTLTNLTWANLRFATENQAITFTADDATGDQHTLTVTLSNIVGAQTGNNIDAAIKALNAALQASNDTTLQRITAIKVRDLSGGATGAEKINFISTLNKFTVGLGTDGGSTGAANIGLATATSGAGTQGVSVTAHQVGAGSALDISTQAGASAALTAITSAVRALGGAQAAVGKSQNQLAYAIGLAQSQISSFSSAESQLRDADIAAEAANLTKASVLQQATMAAMAQANSAPQAVLALLRG
ncbi:MAG TPA: flagellin [Bryobacteraceae bacterium]|nr:flagellin [Bryobacteraceae bacterium]